MALECREPAPELRCFSLPLPRRVTACCQCTGSWDSNYLVLIPSEFSLDDNKVHAEAMRIAAGGDRVRYDTLRDDAALADGFLGCDTVSAGLVLGICRPSSPSLDDCSAHVVRHPADRGPADPHRRRLTSGKRGALSSLYPACRAGGAGFCAALVRQRGDELLRGFNTAPIRTVFQAC